MANPLAYISPPADAYNGPQISRSSGALNRGEYAKVPEPDDDRAENLTDMDIQRMVSAAVGDAIAYTNTDLSPARAMATRYYSGELPDVPQIQGRSQVVLSVVRDKETAFINQIMPVFFGGEQVVEFVPRRPDQTAQAEQKTDYIDFIFKERSNGFQESMNVLKDGLRKRIGIFKYGWDDSVTPKSYCEYACTEDQMHAIASDDTCFLTKVTEEEPEEMPKEKGVLAGLMAKMGQQKPTKTYTVEYTRHLKTGKPWIKSLPPEEFVFSREARSVEHATFVGHRMQKTRGECIALGIDADLIDVNMDKDSLTLNMQPEVIARRELSTNAFMLDPAAGEANYKLTYVEGYMYLDCDNDGIAELRKIVTIGNSYRVVSNEPWDERPFATFSFDPEPHTLQGLSLTDRTQNLQRIQSLAARAMFDSLSLSLFPRTVVMESGVRNMADVYNTEMGAVIVATRDGAVQELTHTFVGKEALPIIQWLDQVSEHQTGVSNGATALDADALQSSTPAAVEAQVSSSQAQIELTCRIFAETLRRVFKGLSRLMVTHQPQSEMVRLRGTWQEVDPRSWDDDMDCMVKVGLGTSFIQNKLMALSMVKQTQEQILQLLGPNNPLVGAGQYRFTLGKMLELNGIKDTQNYFNPLPVNYQPPPQPPQAPQMTPEQTLAQAQMQIEHEKNQKDLAIKQAELQLKMKMADRDYAFKVAKAAEDAAISREQIQAQFKVSMSKQQMDQDQAAQEHRLNQAVATADAAVAIRKQAHDEAVAAHDYASGQQQMQQDAESASEDAGEPQGEAGE